MQEIELCILIDGSGDYGVGKDEEAAKEAYDSDIGGDLAGSRYYRLTLSVPLPSVRSLSATIPAEAEEAVTLAVTG